MQVELSEELVELVREHARNAHEYIKCESPTRADRLMDALTVLEARITSRLYFDLEGKNLWD